MRQLIAIVFVLGVVSSSSHAVDGDLAQKLLAKVEEITKACDLRKDSTVGAIEMKTKYPWIFDEEMSPPLLARFSYAYPLTKAEKLVLIKRSQIQDQCGREIRDILRGQANAYEQSFVDVISHLHQGMLVIDINNDITVYEYMTVSKKRSEIQDNKIKSVNSLMMKTDRASQERGFSEIGNLESDLDVIITESDESAERAKKSGKDECHKIGVFEACI